MMTLIYITTALILWPMVVAFQLIAVVNPVVMVMTSPGNSSRLVAPEVRTAAPPVILTKIDSAAAIPCCVAVNGFSMIRPFLNDAADARACDTPPAASVNAPEGATGVTVPGASSETGSG